MSARLAAKNSPARRWASVLLRAVHLAAVIGLSGSILLAADRSGASWGIAVLISGVALFATDYWGRTDRLREVSAASVGAKLVLVAAMLLLPQWQTALFWSIVIWSVIFAHAPASFRHASIGSPPAKR